jgi:hypothetical protein
LSVVVSSAHSVRLGPNEGHEWSACIKGIAGADPVHIRPSLIAENLVWDGRNGEAGTGSPGDGDSIVPPPVAGAHLLLLRGWAETEPGFRRVRLVRDGRANQTRCCTQQD